MHNATQHLFTDGGISAMVARPGQSIWVNGLVDETVEEFADVTQVSRVLTRVDFITNTVFSVTGIHRENTACTNLHFARENRGRDAGKIFCGRKNVRFWPKLRAAVHKIGADLIETVSAIGGLEFVLTYNDEWLLPDFGRGFKGNVGRIIKADHIKRILAVFEPVKGRGRA